jgi:hypothetical protein
MFWPARKVLERREQFGERKVSCMSTFCTEAKVCEQEAASGLLHLHAPQLSLGAL